MTPALEANFANYVRRVLGPAAKRYGYERTTGEEESVSLLRPALLGWLADEGRDDEARSVAERLGKSFFADRNSVDPSLVRQAVVLSAIRGDATLFADYQHRFETTTFPTDRDNYLDGIGSFRDQKLRTQALAYTLSGPLRPNELFSIPSAVGSTIGQEKEVFDWLVQNYDVFVKKLPPAYMIYMPYFGASCDREMLARAQGVLLGAGAFRAGHGSRARTGAGGRKRLRRAQGPGRQVGGELPGRAGPIEGLGCGPGRRESGSVQVAARSRNWRQKSGVRERSLTPLILLVAGRGFEPLTFGL